jgi:hypothetical protein
MESLISGIKNIGTRIRKSITRTSKKLTRTRKLSPNTILREAQSVENRKIKECHDDIHRELNRMKRQNTTIMKYYMDAMHMCDSLIDSIVMMTKEKGVSRESCEPEIRKIVHQYSNIRKYVIKLVKLILKNVRYSEQDAREFNRMAHEKTEHEIGLQTKTIVTLWLNNLLLVSWLSKINSHTQTRLISTNKCKPHYIDHPNVNIGSKFSNIVAKLAELKFIIKKQFNDDSLTGLFPKQLQSKHI